MLADVRRDMERLSLPSWVARAPSRPGETTQGKFSADQWRTFCTVNLPITLIRRWGSLPKNERKYRMLANYMQLVSAVRLANMREMTEKRIQYFEELIRLYLKGIQELYPHTNITIYQHMMHHFGSLLRRFGPVHSWRCFAFERLNYVLQQTSTNNKLGAFCTLSSLHVIECYPGELEKTMFRRFCMTQKLRSIFHGASLPAYLVSLATIYEKCFESSDTRGTRITDVLAWETAAENSLTEKVDWSDQGQLTALDTQTFKALSHAVKLLTPEVPLRLSPHVHDWKRVEWRDFTFTTQNCAFSDSQVVFDTGKGWSAGCIDRIFSARWIADGSHHYSTFAQVKEYSPLSQQDSQFDNYRDFGFAGGRLFYNHFEKEPIVLPLAQLSSHFGFSIQSVPSITTEIFHALPLNKVSF